MIATWHHSIAPYQCQHHDAANGSTEGDQLCVYRCKKGTGNNDPDVKDILVGDVVVIYGDLINYQGTYEFTTGNVLISLERTKIDPTIVVADATVAYGSSYTIDTDVIEGGEITVTSSNTSVATVNGLVITPVAVGQTTITVATAENASYNAGSETFTLTVTQPEGLSTAPAASEGGVIFEETFAKSNGSCESFSGTDGNGYFSADEGNEWVTSAAYGADGAAKFGSSSKAGSATTPIIAATEGMTYTLTFKAAPWASEEATMIVTATGATISGISDNAMATGQWNEFSATVTATAPSFKLTFEASKKRFFLDEVKVEAPAGVVPTIKVTLNGSGYATYCNQYPLDFTNNEDVTAWALTGIEKDGDGTYKMNYTQIIGAVKGGVGMLLKGTAGATVSLTSVDSDNVPSGNKFVGTLAPTFVEAGAVYGLSGDTFVKSKSAGNVKANKAFIPADELPTDAKSFIFVFEDEATGVRTIETVSAEDAKAIFNIAGQRLQNMQKGINIVGGKKILVK